MRSEKPMNIDICNSLLRTPLSLIVDDSCPVVNLTYYWIHQRHAWKTRHQPGVLPDRWEGMPFNLQKMPPTIPADFAWEWAEWCAENGVKGKLASFPILQASGASMKGLTISRYTNISMAADLSGDHLAQLRSNTGDAHPYGCR